MNIEETASGLKETAVVVECSVWAELCFTKSASDVFFFFCNMNPAKLLQTCCFELVSLVAVLQLRCLSQSSGTRKTGFCLKGFSISTGFKLHYFLVMTHCALMRQTLHLRLHVHKFQFICFAPEYVDAFVPNLSLILNTL